MFSKIPISALSYYVDYSIVGIFLLLLFNSGEFKHVRLEYCSMSSNFSFISATSSKFCNFWIYVVVDGVFFIDSFWKLMFTASFILFSSPLCSMVIDLGLVCTFWLSQNIKMYSFHCYLDVNRRAAWEFLAVFFVCEI